MPLADPQVPPPDAAPACAAARIATDQHGGWLLLLPTPRADDHVLCLELSGVAYAQCLFPWYPAVSVLRQQPQGDSLELTEYRDGRAVASHDAGRDVVGALRGLGRRYSVVTWRCSGHCGDADQVRRLRRLVRLLPAEFAGLLTDDGSCYIEFDNPFCPQGLLSPAATGRMAGMPPARGAWRAAFRGMSARGIALHPLALTRQRVRLVLPARSQPAPAMVLGWRDRLRTLMQEGRGARWFASAFGMRIGTACRTMLLDSLMEQVAACPELPSAGAGARRITAGRVIVALGKALVECHVEARPVPDFLVVVPFDARSIRGRRAELAAMTALRGTGTRVASLLPDLSVELNWLGRPVFAYTFIPGVVVDTNVPQLGEMTQRAGDLLCEFASQTRRSSAGTTESFTSCLADAFAGTGQRYPWAVAAVSELRHDLLQRYLGRGVPLVWMHGDFKLENIIFSVDPVAIAGVIDWELSSPDGLPLLDLLYLLGYERVTRGLAGDILDFIDATVMGDAWTPPERQMVTRQLAVLSLPEDYLPFAAAAFLLHHIGVRFTYPADDAACQARLLGLLARARRMVAPPQPGGTPR